MEDLVMQYRKDKHGEAVSALGYGCMRFTRTAGNIDLEKAEKELMEAYRLGVNYYDTAYVYPGSETAIGKIFQRNGIRERVKIAAKLPQYMVTTPDGIDKYFDEELSRLQTDYVDYYLLHHMTGIVQWEKLCALGIEDWIRDKKQSGRIRNIGFSYHGNTADFLKILDAYDWDMCQIQYNYVDEYAQAGVDGLKAAGRKGIPVVIMEPLRGGKLVNLLPDKAKSLIAAQPSGYSAAEYGLRWLWNQPEIMCVLSGMNSLDMVRENCRIASEAQVGGFRDEDFRVVSEVKNIIAATEKVGCTGCGYCMPCPRGVDIPAAFRCYNRMYTENKGAGRKEYAQTVGLRMDPAFASQCVQCGKCETRCPQSLPIRKKLKEADRALRPLPYRIGISIARKKMLRKMK
jgi:predicted aldo/keto reductase-like oxidoreductase